MNAPISPARSSKSSRPACNHYNREQAKCNGEELDGELRSSKVHYPIVKHEVVEGRMHVCCRYCTILDKLSCAIHTDHVSSAPRLCAPN